MGTCARCGAQSLFLKGSKCAACGRDGCDTCQTILAEWQTFKEVPGRAPQAVQRGRVVTYNPGSPGGYVPHKRVPYRFCGTECFDRWAWGYVQSGAVPMSNGQEWMLAGFVLASAVAQRAVTMYQQFVTQQRLEHARRLIDAEQIEGAAMIYQELGMWKEAGDLRRRARQQVVTQVHVDVNDLVKQLRTMGVSASYTCPVCRSPSLITGSTPPAALTKCQYCGAVTRPTDIVEAITKVLSSR